MAGVRIRAPAGRENTVTHRWALPLLACAALTAARASANVTAPALEPVADAFVTTGPTNNLTTLNYGAAGGLSIAAAATSKGEFQSVMQFDTSSAKAAFDAAYGPGQWALQSATLQLTVAAPLNPMFGNLAAGQFGVSWMGNDTWVEGPGTPSNPSTTGITWTTLPAFESASDTSLGTFAFDGGAITGPVTYSLGVPAAFKGDVAPGGLVSLRLYAADSAVDYLFNSRSFNTAANRPHLTLAATAVPEPVALGAWGVGAVLLLRRKSRRCS